MEPEGIDKLFKNKLTNLPVPPSADAWMRLQAKMEPPKQERTMWVYYAAASVIILLVSSLLLFRNYNQKPTATVAQTEVKTPSEKNKFQDSAVQATTPPEVSSTSETTVVAQVEKEAEVGENEQNSEILKETVEKKEMVKIAQAKPKVAVKKSKEELPGATSDKAKIENASAVAVQNKVITSAENQSIATTNEANKQVVQVLVKQDNTDDTALAYNLDSDFRESLSKKGTLLKNIYKQARNLKNGEPVELATLGLDTEKINSEKENIKQKLSKVISL